MLFICLGLQLNTEGEPLPETTSFLLQSKLSYVKLISFGYIWQHSFCKILNVWKMLDLNCFQG